MFNYIEGVENLRGVRSAGFERGLARAILGEARRGPSRPPSMKVCAVRRATTVGRGAKPPSELLPLRALFCRLAFGADPGAIDDLRLVVATEGPRDERETATAGATLGVRARGHR